MANAVTEGAGAVVVPVEAEKYKYKALIGAIFGFMFDAVDFMVLAMAIPLLVKDWGISLAQAGLLSTATIFGAAMGAYIWGPIADKYGRKYVLSACVAFFGVFTFLCGFAENLTQLMILRFICGLGLGGEWVIGGSMVTEYFPPHQRARATTAVQMGWPIGFALVIGLNGWLTPIFGWRVLFFIGASALLCTAYVLMFVPESPVWVKARENRRKGIIGVSDTVAKASHWLDIFKGGNLKVTLLSIALCTCVLVSYWGTGAWIPAFLMKERGLNIKGLTWFLLAQQGVAVVSYIIFGFIGDRLGRRANLMIGGVASAITVLLYMAAPTYSLIFAAGLLWALAFNGFWGPLPATIAEQYSTQVRGIAVSIAYGTGRLAAAVAPFVMGGIATSYSLGVAIGIMAVFYFGITVFAFFMKETRDTVVVD